MKASKPGAPVGGQEASYRVKLRSSFNGVAAPKYKGDDTVRYANRKLASDASKALRAWKRTLPKGVKV